MVKKNKQFNGVVELNGQSAASTEGPCPLLQAVEEKDARSTGSTTQELQHGPGFSDIDATSCVASREADLKNGFSPHAFRLELEEAFQLHVLNDWCRDQIERLDRKVAANLPNEQESVLDKKRAEFHRAIAVIQQCLNGALTGPAVAVDWGLFAIAHEYEVAVAKGCYARLVSAVSGGNAEEPVPGAVTSGYLPLKKVSESNAILTELARQGYDPSALPRVSGKQSGAKAKVWGAIGRMFTSRDSFDARWKMMRETGELGDAPASGQAKD